MKESRKRLGKQKKARHPAGFKPTTSLLQGMSYTSVLQPRPTFLYLFFVYYIGSRDQLKDLCPNIRVLFFGIYHFQRILHRIYHHDLATKYFNLLISEKPI